MTSYSPRIYLYKITFEEVPYYYYGVHKEKRFNEEYWGSPVTNKWCWEFYTPKKQILQLFDFTDEGWLKAQEVENRIILPFLNNPLCLNENCSGLMSLSTRSKAGKIGGNVNAKNKTGVCGLTTEQKREIGKKWGHIGGKKSYELGVGIHGRTEEQKSQDGKINGKVGIDKQKETGTGFYGIPKEKRIEYGSKGGLTSGKKSKENQTGIFSQECLSKRKEYGSKGGSISSNQKWQCMETGFISNSGGLSSYQKARGIDTSKNNRKKL